MLRWTHAVIGSVLLASAQAVQPPIERGPPTPITDPSQRMEWEQTDHAAVSEYQIQIDAGVSSWMTLLNPKPVTGTTIEAPFPAMPRGRHDLIIRACTQGQCSPASNVLPINYRIR